MQMPMSQKEKKCTPIIICIIVLMLSCGNKNKDLNDSLDWECLDSINKAKEKAFEIKEEAAIEMKRTKNPIKLSPGISSSSGRNTSTNDDNMRGFDPASEDDMDDNGMSRYMENNDEEGWY